MVLLGCKPIGRNTEQHDVFFGIGKQVKDLVPDIIKFWPEAGQTIHVDAWREVTVAGEYDISVVKKADLMNPVPVAPARLFFINLGGYKPTEFEEFHYKLLVAANNKGEAVQESKRTAFYQHTGFAGASSHVDDKYGIDVDDMYEIADILPSAIKHAYTLVLSPSAGQRTDEIHLGYFKLEKL